LDEHWVQQWAAAVTAVPCTDEICSSVTDTLLQIAYSSSLQSHIPIVVWSWLRKSPPLPPVCAGCYWGSSSGVIEVVQRLGDIETLTAYVSLIWSEWQDQYSTYVMDALIRGDFSGIRMGYHRKKLLQHLDHVLGQLELGLEYLQQYNPDISGDDIQQRQGQYRQLREVLLEVDREAIELLVCESSRLVILVCLLTCVYR